MRTLVVNIEYAVVSPIVLENRISKAYPCWVSAKDINEDYFELMVSAREEDVASIEKILAQYV